MESSPESAAWLTIPAMRAGPRPRLRRSDTVRFSREVLVRAGPGSGVAETTGRGGRLRRLLGIGATTCRPWAVKR